MKQQYNVDDHAQHIYETRLDDFFNYLATQKVLREVLWCVFDEAKEYKHCQQVSGFIKRNQWKQHVFRLLDAGNKHAWMLLTEISRCGSSQNGSHKSFITQRLACGRIYYCPACWR